MAPEVIERVKATMVACSQQCLNAMRKEGIKVLALLSQDVDAIDKIQCSVQTARWRRILEVRHSIPAAWKSAEWRGGGGCSAPCCAAGPSCKLPLQQRRMDPASWQPIGVLCYAAATRRKGAAEEADASQLRSRAAIPCREQACHEGGVPLF